MLSFKLLIVTIYALALTQAGPLPGFRCPPDDIATGCNQAKQCLYANPDDCSSFVQCTGSGDNFVIGCPPGLEWNDRVKQCDWPQLSTCKENNPVAPEAGNNNGGFVCPVEDIVNTKCMGPKDCLYPNPDNCNTFIQCTVDPGERSGTPVVMLCLAGLEWNDNEKICDWPGSSTCKDKYPVSPTPMATTTTTPTRDNDNNGEFVCPADDCIQTGCLYQYPGDCTKFWQCDLWGNAYVKQCPPPLEFNEKIHVCDWAPSPTCKPGVTSMPTTTTTTQRPVTSEVTTSTPTQESTPDKPSTAESTSEQPIETTTTAESTQRPTTSPGQGSSDEPIETTTGAEQSTSGTDDCLQHSSTTIINSGDSDGFKCPAEDVISTQCKGPKDCLYPNPDNCNSFIQCTVNADGVSGTPVVMPCPAGLEWNDIEKICDWPYQSTCPGKDPQDSTTEKLEWDSTVAIDKTTAGNGVDFQCPRDDIINTQCMGPKDCLYPHPNNCHQFIHCEVNADGQSGRPTVKDCPAGLEWNDHDKICDWPNQSTCIKVTPDSPSSSTQSNPGTDDDMITPDSESGFVCPVEDIISTQCMGPKDCLYPQPTDCSQFIHCEVNADGRTGRPTIKDCPAGLLWNDNDKICDWPGSSTCKDNNPVSSTTRATTTTTPIPDNNGGFVCPVEDIVNTKCMGPKDCLYPNPDNCNTFIQCTVDPGERSGTPVIMPCPGGLEWNDRDKICDWPRNSTCPNPRYYQLK